MTALVVRGGKPLTGSVEPSANKNAVLPVLCATLLSDGPITLRNVPEITDVTRIVEFFGELGSTVNWDKADKRLDHDDPGPARPPRRGAARARGQGLHARCARDRPARCGVPRVRRRCRPVGARDRLPRHR